MRNILILTLLSLLVTITSLAKENVTIVYSWTAADGPANYSRAIIEEANRLQNKYNFIFDTKPGAGGSLAAKYVKHTPNTILATASAFFVRPNFFPNESYALDTYREILLQCTAPIAITAMKYKTWADVPKDQPLTIGVSGLGTTTHLLATQIKAKYRQLTIIPFKSTSESLLSVASGNTDLHVAFLGEVETWGGDNPKYGRLLVLGISGHGSVRGLPTLISQGFGITVANISVPFHLVVPSNISNDKFVEWRQILVEASKNPSVKETYKSDACVPGNLTDVELHTWYRNQIEQWRRISAGVKITP